MLEMKFLHYLYVYQNSSLRFSIPGNNISARFGMKIASKGAKRKAQRVKSRDFFNKVYRSIFVAEIIPSFYRIGIIKG